MSRSSNAQLNTQLVEEQALGASTQVIPFPSVRTIKQVILDFIELTKPRIMLLLLISTCCPMFLAANGHADLWQIFWALIGGALVSGSASVMNCVYDRDIDAVMERTKSRPIPAGRVSPTAAFVFSVVLGVAGLMVLTTELNLYAGLIALYGHFFYVVIYTICLKRFTPQNIVIGGAAGAIPPLVGWAGVTGSLDWTAILLFMIVFLWTPPHFWALALNKNADYRRAKVPMLPVMAGEKETHRQMLWYALSLIPCSLLLVYSHQALGWFSYAVLGGLSVVFAYKCYQLKTLPLDKEPERRTEKAWDVFGFSLIYLALLFVCLVVDSVVV